MTQFRKPSLNHNFSLLFNHISTISHPVLKKSIIGNLERIITLPITEAKCLKWTLISLKNKNNRIKVMNVCHLIFINTFHNHISTALLQRKNNINLNIRFFQKKMTVIKISNID